MTSRSWLYLTSGIIIVALLLWAAMASSTIRQQQILINDASTNQLKDGLSSYLSGQTDFHKVISLAKQLKSLDSSITVLIADRAYALAPDSRDALVLDSVYHPELKSKIPTLDPLYSATN